jgi:hypothetical protein
MAEGQEKSSNSGLLWMSINTHGRLEGRHACTPCWAARRPDIPVP